MALHLIGLALGFGTLVAGRLADALFDVALDLVHRAGHRWSFRCVRGQIALSKPIAVTAMPFLRNQPRSLIRRDAPPRELHEARSSLKLPTTIAGFSRSFDMGSTSTSYAHQPRFVTP